MKWMEHDSLDNDIDDDGDDAACIIPSYTIGDGMQLRTTFARLCVYRLIL